ncbi:hepcidin-like [Entelurus aequoreus]|uniref:hepcidin-like n=1 Tax=Entelurus aequoreus TaxID=161455 RepID=UPI002B1E3D72|nr:hepcidin-like [Entelurus aequoreus]
MKTFNLAVAVITLLALILIQEGYAFSLHDDVDQNKDLTDAMKEFHEMPAEQLEMADQSSNNRPKRHSDPKGCRFCCNCCGRRGFCGLCCEWRF